MHLDDVVIDFPGGLITLVNCWCLLIMSECFIHQLDVLYHMCSHCFSCFNGLFTWVAWELPLRCFEVWSGVIGELVQRH